MQRNDANDVKQRRGSGPRDQSGQSPQESVQHYVLTGQLQAITGTGRQTTLGLLPSASPGSSLGGSNVATPVGSSTPLQHQTVVVSSQDLERIFTGGGTPGPTTVATTPALSAQVLQRQLSSQGIVGVISPAVSRPVTGSFPGGATTTLIRQTGATPSGPEMQIPPTLTLVTATTPSGAPGVGTLSASGATVHHHGLSPSRGTPPTPRANLQQPSLNMSIQPTGQQQTPKTNVGAGATAPASATNLAVVGKVLQETKPSITPLGLTHTFPNLTALANQSAMGPSPKKKVKVEEKAPATAEIANNRKLILDQKHKEMKEIKENYIEFLTELFFLQNSGNMMDYHTWKKRPTPQLVHFLKSGNLDSDEEDDHGQERKINNEVKVFTCSGSNVPLATPVAISTTLPPSVAALNQQAPSQRTAASTTNSTTTLTTSTEAAVSMSLLQSQMSKAADTKPPAIHTTHTTKVTHTTSTSSQPQSTVRTTKSPPTSPGGTPRLHTRQHTISNIYDGSIGSQEAIVERAKQEAQVMQRVAELRKEGLWSSRRLPKVQEPPRNKSHWDYLLEEMQWLAADFQQERKWKKAAARKVAKMVSKYFQELEQKEIRAEKEEAQKLKRIAGQIAKQVREFWTNVEKVVQYKQQTRNEEKRKKALDLHLNFIVDQTEKYSTWLTEGLKKDSRAGSSIASGGTTPDHSIDGGDREFEPEADESDDEETIEKAEADMDETSTKAELDALQKEGEVPLEELLKSLPQEVLSGTASLTEVKEEADDQKQDKEDDEFAASEEEEVDVEETIEEQEKLDKKVDYSKELEDLQNEGDMDMEELYKKYAGAYDSDFEMPESESGTDDDSDDDEDDDEEDSEEEEESEGEEEEETEENADNKEEEVGLDFLMTSDSANTSQDTQAQGDTEEKGPGKELVDIAAEAQSLQPKGYTLQTTEVKTKVPFLIKHTLREYQHVGLDWLATMYEKRLNGILADEMGLGKTIQTIALLAHLACDKGIWGPHLIVVPTSVMLNWEMEIKKWCPAFKILTYYGNQKERKLKRQGWTKTNAFHVCITSYKLVIQDHQSFRRKKWKYFILDEAQNIKNFKSQRWQTLLNFSSQRRLLLTGTPLQNNLMELWSLMHFLMPNVFQSHREFKEWFANPLTGMIEGSHEYNESLIKRLHKVLRPFLLRRLKADVEKQMPKKYEHVVMCQLSKRQRFLYDDFMSQGKTKETLASGHFMSVINILMQLRKVCNHPSLFDERPTVSPFQTEGITFHTSSAVVHMLDYDPFKDIDLLRYPGLADMEQDLPAFVAHRVKRLQTSRQLIEEIDDQPDPPPRLKPGKLKPVNFRSISPLSRSVSPLTNQTSATSGTEKAKPATSVTTSSATTTAAVGTTITSTTPTTLTAAVTPRTQSTVTMTTSSVTQPLSVTSVSSVSVASTLTSTGVTTPQAKVGPITTATVSLPSSSSQVATSQPITVQIQQTDQGARLMIPAGQLSQLPAGFIQIVQTSMGQQIIASSVATTAQQRVGSPSITTTSSRATTTSSAIVNGLPAITTIAGSAASTTLTTVASQVKPAMSVQLPLASTQATLKPVMKVSPMVTASTSTTNVVKTGVSTTASSTDIKATTGHSTRSAVRKVKQRNKSELLLDSLCDRRDCQRQEKLEYIARINKLHCERKPVYGQDLRCTVNVMSDTVKTCVRDNTWPSLGHIHCTNINSWSNPHHPEIFWNQTKVLSNLVHTPLQYLQELEDILSRYVFATPPVVSPCIKMHVSHPPPSNVMNERWRDFILHKDVSPKASCLHKISTNRMVQFPELRLIQYDCGKLQTLDLLLRRLKSGDHRVLIFTQMTKMLNILESFLSYHGHRYLRLDGTTRVEQRQFLMDRFNADKRIFCFILSTRSGGIGVNLTGADTVIFYDSDWNPTMDAQAQDRCHRIGQTRDVHIYRLISKKTVEENILKKANQKRMLGDMAIEGGNFTTAFFKENTIQELFSEPSGLDSLVEQPKVIEVKTKPQVVDVKDSKALGGGDEKPTQSEKSIVAQFEQALGKAEDETDVVAANLVKAEQKAELAEFDENIPWDEREAEKRKEEEEMSKAEQELAMLDKELSPIERFAVAFMENEMKPDDDLEISVEEIANSKKDWELARLKALKEDEERRLELEEDEMLYTYLRDDSFNQVFISDTDQEHMPMWAPPTPPHDDNDIYLDQTMCFLYEPAVMPESQLPPIYIKKEHKKPKVESITTRKQKQRKEEQPRVPRSLFDRPTAALLRMRREAKLKQGGLLKPFRPVPPVINKPTDQSADHPEWLIHEDWALLQAVQSLFDVPLNLMVVSPAHQLNWDLVADIVSSVSRVYRSAKQCRNRYENVIIPREEGRILYDINPRKQSKKTKGIYKTKNNRPMRTSQLYVQDGNQAITMLHSLRFDSAKTLAAKRPPTLKQTLVSPTPKNPKHAAVLSESGITYDQPLDPMNVAEIRAQRIQREKKQNQAAAAATAEQQHLAARTLAQQQAAATQASPAAPATAQPQPVTVTAAIAIPQGAVPQGAVAQQLQPIQTTVASAVMAATAVPKSVVQQGAASVSLARSAVGATGNIVVNTPSGVGGNFAAINRRMSQATSLGQASTVTVTGTLNPAIRAQRPLTIPIQEITAITSQTGQVTHVATTGQVARTQIQTTVPTLTSTQLARIASTQGTTLPSGTVQATMTKALTQQQLIALTQRQQQRQAAFQQQQPRKLNLTPDQINQQRLKQLQQQGRSVGAPKVIAQQLVTSLAQVPKQKMGTSLARPIPQELLLQQKLPQKTQVQVVAQGQAGTQLQQIHMATTQGGAGIPTTQIIQAQVHQVGQPATLTTAVKTSAAGTPIQITQLPQQKAGVAKATTINQLQPALKQMQLIGQQKRPLQQPSKITSLGQVGKPVPLNAVQIIQQPSTGQNVTYQLQQLVKRNPGSGMIITSQPTIIATVTQGQQGQLVHKVLSTSATQSSHLQTITAASNPVTHATIVTGTPQMSVATLSLATASSQATKPTVVSTLSTDPRQAVHSVAPQQAKIATISQSTATSQTIQQIQVTPATLQQVHTTVSAPTVPQPLTVTVAPSSQSPALTATILQTIPAPVQQESPPVPQATTQIQVTTIPQSSANVASQQTLLPVGAVTAQAAAAAVQALPQGTAQGIVSVTQSPQQQAAAAAAAAAGSKAPYAMRTRNPPKH